jgi:hypothetical protein
VLDVLAVRCEFHIFFFSFHVHVVDVIAGTPVTLHVQIQYILNRNLGNMQTDTLNLLQPSWARSQVRLHLVFERRGVAVIDVLFLVPK